MEILPEDIKVFITTIDSSKPLATCKIEFGNSFVIKGFKIMPSKFAKYWVQAPAFRGTNGKFHDIVFFTDKELWAVIEAKIIKRLESDLDKPW